MEIYSSTTYVEPFLPPLYPAFKTANVTETWGCHLVWWIVSYYCAYCACRCCWYPKVAPFKCMLSKSRGVLFLSVQKFEAFPTGIRFDNWNTNCKFIERLQNLEFKPRIIERKAQSLVFSSMIYEGLVWRRSWTKVRDVRLLNTNTSAVYKRQLWTTMQCLVK